MLASAVSVHVHVSASAALVGAEMDHEAAIAEIGLGIADQCQRCSRFGRRRGLYREAGETVGTLAVRPYDTKILCCQAPDCGSITGVEAYNRAPDVRRGGTIIHKERVGPAASDQQIRAGPTVQYVDAAADRDRIIAATAADEPARGCRADIQAIARDADILAAAATSCPVAVSSTAIEEFA